MNKKIGVKLKDLRKLKGFTYEEIAELLNVSQSTYIRMEKGETATWTTMIDKICTIYTIEPEELLLNNEKYALLIDSIKEDPKSSSVSFINYLSDKVIELYEKMLNEKDKKIDELEKKINKL